MLLRHFLRALRSQTWSQRPRHAFTLIELLVVIVVITLLASLVAPNVFRHMGTARDAAARAQIEMLGAALDAYRLDLGRYPTTDEGLGALMQRPTGASVTQWRGPYLRRGVPQDPWGQAYAYTSPGAASQSGYDLLSYGADKAPGGTGDNADITSWKQ
jgi:general secretion pathway protein G